MERKVKTPCVGVCSTVFGDRVCRGCKRFHHEVIEWNGYTDSQKETVWNRLESLKVLIMKSKILIEDKILYEKLKLVKDVREANPDGPYKKILREQYGMVN